MSRKHTGIKKTNEGTLLIMILVPFLFPFLLNIPALRACDSSPCKNGGTCEDRGLGSYDCICPKGYIGAKCGKGIKKKQHFIFHTR